MLKQITNCRILTPAGWLEGGSILVEDNKIKEVLTSATPVAGAEVVDAKNCIAAPGGIEMHVHGGGGRDFMEGTEEAFRVAVNAHLQNGTTAIFPTLSSSTVPMIEAACETCDKMMAEPDSPVLGLHLEGPYFNPKQAGAQIPEWIKAPVKDEYAPLLDKYKCLKRWDEAPELPGSNKFDVPLLIEEFGRAGLNFDVAGRNFIDVQNIFHKMEQRTLIAAYKFYCGKNLEEAHSALADTRATYEDVHRANEAGMTHATHFYNAMPVVYKNREFKVAGTVESIFAEQNMTVEMIADGIHVPPIMLRMIYQIKGVEKTALVTDSLACSCTHGDAAFDPRVILEDGVCKLADRSALAGSIATMDRLIRTCVQQAGIPLEDAFRMSSETPARIMGVLDRKGTLEAGKDADIVLYTPEALELKYVMQMGREVRNEL